MENKVTISELPELDSVLGTESIPIDSYDDAQAKNKTFRVSVEAIKKFVESGLGEVVTQEQILVWDTKETTQGAQDKVDAGLVLAKEYTDEELVAVNLAINNLTDLLTSDDVALDELQEIVDFIKLNRSNLDSLSIASIAGLDDALEEKADVSVLELKADVSALDDKVDLVTMTSALGLKADVSVLEGKVDAGLVLAKEYTDEELVAVKAAVTALEDLLVSGDVDLDDLQEIVDFIKLNRSDLDSLTTASIAGLDDALKDKADVSALEDKVDTATLTAALKDKADVSALALKADVSALEDKVDTETLTAALELKADVSALEDKVDTETLTAALELKADVSALEDKADVSALELKADVKNSFEVVTEDKTIVNADAGKTLFVTADCILTVSDYDSLDDGFNCKIIVDADTIAVAFAESDSVRGDHTEILEDTTLIKTPNEGVFVFFGK